jgi:NAD(P)-dependent dehydrogenase (short-subunit alcohol dehydrogenase family)
MLLDGRVALVTGAAAGIGRGIARCFAGAGATVAVVDIDTEAGEQVVAELESLGGGGCFLVADVLQPETVVAAVERTLERFGRLDVLVNNAYPTMRHMPAAIEDIDSNRLAEGLTAGFQSAAAAMRAGFPAMRDAGYGRIVNICSLNGINAHKYTADYNAAKEALRSYTRTAAAEWARHGITANIICPGAVTTPFEALMAFNPDMADEIARLNPMGYMGDPETDIAPVALFLASDMARYVTGNTLFADGGGHINGVPWSPEPVDTGSSS